MQEQPDVLVIGAGPAGSVAAALLAQRGYQVLVLERQRFPRFSIGESLLAYSAQLLMEAGMFDSVVSAGFQYKNGAAFVCGEQRAEFNFADKITEGCPFTFQVVRSEFDLVLANAAQRFGAAICYGAEIIHVDFSSEMPKVTARFDTGENVQFQPRFVLDASGFGRTLPRLLDLEKPSSFPVRTARFCHIKDQIVAGEFDRQKIRIGINPVQRDVWSWLIPFPNGTCSLGIVAAPEFIARWAPRSQRSDDADLDIWALVAQEPALRALLRDAQTTRPVGEIVGYSANVTALYGRSFALLGNAAEFLDPVFSSGVTIAMHSAKLAADVLHRQFRGESVNWQVEYADALAFGVETFRTFVSTWYDGTLQDVIFYPEKSPEIHRRICSVLAGYVWDPANPYNGAHSARRLRALAEMCRPTTQSRLDSPPC